MKNRWLWIGCGGCLGMLLIAVLALVAIGVMFRNYGRRIEAVQRQVDSEFQALARDFPFTAPAEEAAVERKRYEQFLAVRGNVTSAMELQMGWILTLAGSRPGRESMGVIEIARKVVGLPMQLLEIARAESRALRLNQMSREEYNWLTRMTAAEIHSWLELPESDERTTQARLYFRPLTELQTWRENMERQKKGSRMEIGPFDHDRFVKDLQSFKSEQHLNRELVSSSIDAITSPPTAILADVVVVNRMEGL